MVLVILIINKYKREVEKTTHLNKNSNILMLLVIKLIKLDASACSNDVSYIASLPDPSSSRIAYALEAIRSAIFD